MQSNIKDVKELELNKNNDIVIFAKELALLIPNIKEAGWNKKDVLMPNSKYLEEKNQKIFNNFIVSYKLNDMIKNVVNIMNNNGFIYNTNNIDFQNTMVEFHYANSYDGYGYKYPMFTIHKDNDNCNLVNTFICYFDVDCDEGEFAIYENNNENTILSKINIRSTNENIKALIFSGDIYHNALKFKNGHRYALSFQIPICISKTI